MRIARVPLSQSLQEDQLASCIQQAGMECVEVNWQEPLALCGDFAAYIIEGDFSTAARAAGILQPFLQQQHILGKPLLGILGGAELLIKSGIVPGLANQQPCLTLVDEPILASYIRPTEHYQLNAFTETLTPAGLLAITSPQKQFIIPAGLDYELHLQGLKVFAYCDAQGHILQAAPAAISNKMGNAMAMLANPSDQQLFQSLLAYLNKGYQPTVAPLNYFARIN